MRHIFRLFLVTLVVGFGLPACANSVRSGLEADLRKRAAFEFQCPEGQVTLTPLGEFSPGTDTPKSEGVSGCGKQAVYVYVWQQGAYVNNSTSGVKKD
jgi:hypothetical protein